VETGDRHTVDSNGGTRCGDHPEHLDEVNSARGAVSRAGIEVHRLERVLAASRVAYTAAVKREVAEYDRARREAPAGG